MMAGTKEKKTTGFYPTAVFEITPYAEHHFVRVSSLCYLRQLIHLKMHCVKYCTTMLPKERIYPTILRGYTGEPGDGASYEVVIELIIKGMVVHQN